MRILYGKFPERSVIELFELYTMRIGFSLSFVTNAWETKTAFTQYKVTLSSEQIFNQKFGK